MKRSTLMTISVAAHVALGVGLGAIQVKEALDPTPIELADVKEKPKPKKDERKPEPPPPPKAAPKQQNRPAPAAEATPAAADPNAGFSNLPDFGLAMAGGAGVTGIAVPAPRALELKPVEAPVKKLAAPPPPPRRATCAAEPSKPKPLSVPRPEYPASAHSVEGRVRLELTVGPEGDVLNVRVLQSLGGDTDALAAAAARRARFAPALSCGKPTTGTFTVAMRFVAG